MTLESWLHILLGLATSAIFVYVAGEQSAGRQPLVARLLDARPCVFLGTFSYSLYLTHEPILRALVNVIGPLALSEHVAVLLVYAVFVPALLAFAFGFSLLFERPFVSTYRRRADDRIIAHGTPPASRVAVS